jgi:hypothetical protein
MILTYLIPSLHKLKGVALAIHHIGSDEFVGKVKATVEFRFSQRLGDETTAHETGIFLYTTTDAQGRYVIEATPVPFALVRK